MSERHKEAAKRRGEARTAEVAVKVQEAMRIIAEEMALNEGIYPSNGGDVSMIEVARRARINETTLFAPKQGDLRELVKRWLNSLKTKEVVGRGRVRRTVFERSEDWRNLYLDLQNQHVLVELELQDAQVELEAERKKVAELVERHDALLEQIRKGAARKVVAIPVKARR